MAFYNEEDTLKLIPAMKQLFLTVNISFQYDYFKDKGVKYTCSRDSTSEKNISDGGKLFNKCFYKPMQSACPK